ncbi:MAG: Hemin-binding periplasmic protein HmuT precursor [Spirochaetes bacterium ADurb.Bin315]|nr:ABC transporter substrate-binding protein [Spirochaetota bacterium]NLL25437.1 ABC transporter substrate-binding protein [Spirochaetales bacterium]OQA45388.1 MAG: Hemin-binding periplasmic protein HmuT precursor [Spirochaetes bacterium ADurb.Bin315]
MKRHFLTPLFIVISMIVLMLAPLSAQGMMEQPVEQRVVSLSPNVTETIYALGGENLLVGRSDYCNYPAEAEALPSVGTLYNPSLEMILALEPTHVISSAFVPDELLFSIEQANINVLSISAQETFEGTYDLIRAVGDVIHRQSQAEQLIGEMKAQVKAIEEKAAPLSKVTVYMALDFGSFDSAATGDTFLHEMIEKAGGLNVAADGLYWTYSKELLVEKDPELILLSPRWGESEDATIREFKTTKPYSDLKATVKGFDADVVLRQGPRSAQALQILFDLIDGER